MRKTRIVFQLCLERLTADVVTLFHDTTPMSIECGVHLASLTPAPQDICYVVLDGTAVREVKTAIPAKSRAILTKALPHALGEQLISASHDTHFCIMQYAFEAQTIHLVSLGLLKRVVSACESVGITVDAIFSELSLRDVLDGEYKLIENADRTLVCLGAANAYVCNREQRDAMLALSLSTLPAAPASLSWYHVDAPTLTQTDTYQGIAVVDTFLDNAQWLGLSAQWIQANKPVSLLPASFYPKKAAMKTLWLVLVGLLLATAIIPVASQVTQYYLLQQKLVSLQDKIAKTYRPFIPDDRSPVAARDDMIKQLDYQLQTESGDHFLTGLHIIGFAIVDHPDITLQTVHFQAGKLLFTVSAGEDDDGDIFFERMKGHGVIHRIAVSRVNSEHDADEHQLTFQMEPS